MADENKLLLLIGEDEELKKLLSDMLEDAKIEALEDFEKADEDALKVATKKAFDKGFAKGNKDGFAEGEKAALESKKPAEKESVKPNCFNKYKKSYEKHPKKCRGCTFAQACK